MVVISLKNYGKVLFIALFLAFFYASYKIIAPFIPSILTAIILSIITYPLYEKLNKKFRKNNLSAFAIIILTILILIIPSIFFANTLLHEAIVLHNSVGTIDFHTPSEKLKDITGLNIEFDRYITESIKDFTSIFIQSSSKIIRFLATGFIFLFTTFFMMFFFLKGGKKLKNELKKSIPISKYQKTRLFKGTEDIIKGIFFGLFVVAILQFFVSLIGFSIFKIPNPLLWSLMVAILALIPALGSTIIWVPAAIYLFIKGNVISAIIMCIYFGTIVSFYLDSIFKNQIIGKKAKVNPIISLLGILGGIKLWGIAGIVIGPLFLSLFVLIYKLYREENVNT
tara:strand:+ start:52 stop:1068 length:1017 start_codon:yes stop_codon:yes gene_type:complete